MLAFTITLFAYTVLATVPPTSESTHQAQLAAKAPTPGSTHHAQIDANAPKLESTHQAQLAANAPALESTHKADLAVNSSIVGAFDTSDGFGFATLDAGSNLYVYNSNGERISKKPLQTTVIKEKFWGLINQTLTLRAPVKGYGKRVAYMLVDGKTLVDRDVGGAAEGIQYKLKGATGVAFDVDDHHIAYVKDKNIVVLDKANPKKLIASIPVRATEKGELLEIRNLELEGTKLAITYRERYQVVDFSSPAALKTEIDVHVPYIDTQLVTTNKGEDIYHATINEDGDCKAYTGGIKEHIRVNTKEKSYSFLVKHKYEVKAGKGTVIAINGQLKELMTVRVDADQALVQRFKL